jgi:hypothetical protein
VFSRALRAERMLENRCLRAAANGRRLGPTEGYSSMDEKTIARFWQKVDRCGPDECWEWLTGLSRWGYGAFSVGGRAGGNVYAHRFSFELHVGPIPQGLWILHSCDNPPCVNPAHLSLGSSSVNQLERTARGRRPAPPLIRLPRQPSIRPTLAERFWCNVDKQGPTPTACPELGPCHLWTASCDRAGYGKIRANGKQEKAHRVGFFLKHGHWPTPCGLHSCDNPACCNGDHIYAGSMGDNNRDRNARGRHARGAAITANRNTACGERSAAHLHPASYRGERNGNAKLTAVRVRAILKLAKSGFSNVAIARRSQVSEGAVRFIRSGHTWGHLTGIRRR